RHSSSRPSAARIGTSPTSRCRSRMRVLPFSPCGRRWREAPDEGSPSAHSMEVTRGDIPLTRLRVPRSHPLPQGERVRATQLLAAPFTSRRPLDECTTATYLYAVPPRILTLPAEPAALLPDRFAAWFAARGWSPRAHQLALLKKARENRSALLIAPTGAGKT